RSRGLSVLLRETSIFTRTAISPGPWFTQWGSRYAIRAGRNLPDKEFRYLRMVIVTTAVRWRLDSQLHQPNQSDTSSERSSTGQTSVRIQRLTTSHGPVFLINSRFPPPSATPPSSRRTVLHQTGLPFSQSYGDNLPSSLTMVHPNASVSST